MAIFLILTPQASLTRAAGDHEMAGIPLVLISEPQGRAKQRKDCLWSRSDLVSGLGLQEYERVSLFIWVPDRPYKDLDSGSSGNQKHVRPCSNECQVEKVNVAAYGVSGVGTEVGWSGLANQRL